MAKKGTNLTPKERLFVEFYTIPGSPTMGNAVLSYMEAYGIDCPTTKTYKRIIRDETGKETGKIDDYYPEYKNSKSKASLLLTKANIRAYSTELLLKLKTDQFVDGELMRAIGQNKDHSSKVQAIKEYNALMNRVRNKLELTVDDRRELSPEKRRQMAEYIIKRTGKKPGKKK